MQINITFNSLEEMFSFSGEIRRMADPGLKALITGEDRMRTSSESKVIKTKPAQAKEKDEPAQDESTTEGSEPIQEETAAEPVTYTLVDVRGALAALNKAGKKVQVQELIKSFGVDKLSQIPEDKFPELMQKAGEL